MTSLGLDLPPGKWTPLLIGAQWPSSRTREMLAAAVRKRRGLATAYANHSDQLANFIMGPLASQEGVTADKSRQQHEAGRDHAQTVTDKNSAKSAAYTKAHQAISDLRSELQTLAANGNAAIEQIENSKDPLRVAKIVQIIMDTQTQANTKAAARTDDIFQGVQDILSREGVAISAREFAKGLGFETADAFRSPNETELTKQVSELANTPLGGTDADASGASAFVAGGYDAPPPPAPLTGAGNPGGSSGFSNVAAGASTPELGQTTGHTAPAALVDQANVASIPSATPGIAPPGSAFTPSITSAPSIPGTSAPSLSSLTSTGSASTSPLSSLGSNIPSFQPLTPDKLMESFTSGAQSGAPLSSGAHALSAAIQPPMAHQDVTAAPILSSNYSPSTAPTSGGFFGEMAMPANAPVPAPTVAAPPVGATMAAAAAPMAPPAAAPAATAGPLPAYGADLRPAAPTIASPPVMGPPASAPASAPVTAGTAGSALVHKAPVQSGPQAQSANASGLTETASATAATTAGAAAADAATHARLRKVVEAVAHQQPNIRWAAGERQDGAIVLVTDIACGWIPPGIEIPAGVKILEPARRSGGLERLLGEVVAVESWTPGQHLPKDHDEVNMSLRGRDLPEVGDLAWELTQVTNWRDGLPRLAHTLAKAGLAGTGVLDSEIDLLVEHLLTVSRIALKDYPDSIDADAIGNWQLLAAITALVAGQQTALNYHFAWFQSLETAGSR